MLHNLFQGENDGATNRSYIEAENGSFLSFSLLFHTSFSLSGDWWEAELLCQSHHARCCLVEVSWMQSVLPRNISQVPP